MKKLLRCMLSVVLVLALVLSMGVAAFAVDADDGLPVEYVSYVNGLFGEVGVDRHGLSEDDVTIGGISWRPRMTEDEIYVQVVDLGLVKLLICMADKASELGIDYGKLYIENGLVQVKEDVPAAEAEELRAKLAELLNNTGIGLNTGEGFPIGSGGKAAFVVVVAGFSAEGGSAGLVEDDKPLNDGGLKIYWIGIGMAKEETTGLWEADIDAYSEEDFNHDNETALYLVYNGLTYFSRYDLTATPPDGISAKKDSTGFFGMTKEKDDSNKYYFKVEYEGASEEAKFEDAYIFMDEMAQGNYAAPLFADSSNQSLAKKIIIATDPDGKNIVMTVNIEDKTCAPENVYDEINEGTMYSHLDGYIGLEYETDFNEAEVMYQPKETLTVEENGPNEATATVTDYICATNTEPPSVPG